MSQPLITNIQKYSIHDGSGIRTTVFFKGCPLSCKWCHNPETQEYRKELLFYEERCVGCGACEQVCPAGAISWKQWENETREKKPGELLGEMPEKLGELPGEMAEKPGEMPGEMPGKKPIEMPGGREVLPKLAITDRSKCVACGACVEECFHNARELCGRGWEISALLKEIYKDTTFYETSGGGVTLSGGEVLAQNMDYLEKLMKSLHGRGISINIDTCGAVPRERLERVLPYTDTFLFDLKLMDEEKHKYYTGRNNREILENLKWLSVRETSLRIRIPVIGGVNDTEEELGKMADFLKENRIRYRQVHLLPYHNTGSGKYGHLKRKYEGTEFYTPEQEQMEKLKILLEKAGICPVVLGG